MTAPSLAPSRRRAPERDRRRPANPRPAQPRPHLKVVPPNTLSVAGRRRRARRFGAALSVILFIGVFGVVAAHVVLTQRQFRLERLEREATAEEARYERLRLDVAELESPERVVAAAQQLGMVPPATITYLASSRSTPATGHKAETPGDEWATVKSHLAAARP
jgi:cell division protein FtsL